jgi:hypothetical protein
MFIWAKCSRIGKCERNNIFFLSFFDKRSFDETFENIWENADYVNMHDFKISSEKLVFVVFSNPPSASADILRLSLRTVASSFIKEAIS